MCTRAKVGEQRGGGWVLWVQQQSRQVNPCSPNTRASQNSGGPPSFSYFANLSTANLLLTSSLLSSSPCQHGCPQALSQQSHCLSVGDITGWHREAGGE